MGGSRKSSLDRMTEGTCGMLGGLHVDTSRTSIGLFGESFIWDLIC